MAEKLELEVVTPDRLVVKEPVDIVMAMGALGEFGILPNHIPFLTTLQPGELRYRKDSQLEYMAVTGGFAEVSNNKVTILAEAAERAGRLISIGPNGPKSGLKNAWPWPRPRTLIICGLKWP